MSMRSFLVAPATVTLLCLVSSAKGVTVQQPDDVLPDGSAFLFLEGEDVVALGDKSPSESTTGFVVVNKDNPIQTILVDASGADVVKGGLDVLPADTNASRGGALFDQLGADAANTARWQVQFAIPATYYLYMHWSMYNRDNNTNYGNEDSFYVPPSFNANSRDDWIGFEGVDALTGEPKIGDSNRDGWIDGFATMVNIMSADVVETHNSTDEDFWDGQFHWIWVDRANDMDENDAYVSFDGHGIQYEVAEEDVGMVLDFEISRREPYGVIDGFLFSTSSELLRDFTQEEMDEFFLVEGAVTSLQAGDADQDLDFDQLDLVKVQIGGKYLTGQPATWGEGDWNGAPGGQVGSPPAGDGLFNQLDIIAAQLADVYLTGPYGALAGPGTANDGQTSVGYNPETGEVWVDAPSGAELTSINIDSASGIFTGDAAQNLGGSFDNDADNNIFKATFGSSFGSISFGNVAAPGLSEAMLLDDLTVVGSLAGGGDLGNVDLIYVPEPTTALLAFLALMGLIRRRPIESRSDTCADCP